MCIDFFLKRERKDGGRCGEKVGGRKGERDREIYVREKH